MTAEDLRHYLCPTEEDPERRKTIVRDGEVLIGPMSGHVTELDAAVVNELRNADVPIGDGVQHDPVRLQWRARVPGFGYLEVEEDGRLVVVPAVKISEDRLRATIDLRAPTGSEHPISRYEYDVAIESSRIRFGLAKGRIETTWKIYESSGALPGPMQIAAGTPPQPGVGARVKYFLDIERDAGSVYDMEGQIDFREQHQIINVHRLQELGRWRRRTEPIPGQGVDGKEILTAKAGADIPLRVGENIIKRQEKDGSVLLLSEIEGMLTFTESGIPSVTDTVRIEEDVDLSTGNVIANGTVIIDGSVRAGFRVDASKDITVRGIVEGAELQAGGSVRVEEGLIGEQDVKVIAGGDVTVKYSQNTWIEAKGDVEIQGSETASRIECRGSITATEGKGRLQGGRYRAGGSIVVQELGSELGVPTFVFAGVDPLNEREAKKILNQLRELNAEERKQRRSAMTVAASSGKAPINTADIARRRKHLNAQLARLQDGAGAGDEATITVLGTAYYGVEIAIGRHTLPLDESMTSPCFAINPETGTFEI